MLRTSLFGLLLLVAVLVACPATPEILCPEGLQRCGSLCLVLETDPRHCGACDMACDTDQVCEQGKCIARGSCGKEQAFCGGLCVSTSRDPLHCGACGNGCGPGQSCQNGRCDCVPPFVSCGGRCIDTQAHGKHCGACGNECPAGQVCADGRCLSSCPSATSEPCEGGCVNLDNNLLHCGTCGRECQAGESCQKGVCGCAAGAVKCGAECVKLERDRRHCGACGNKCPEGQVCAKGICTNTCPAPTTTCFGLCVDTQKDDAHCGKCGEACPFGTRCVEGACVCEGTKALCENTCFDLQLSSKHCGRCGNACPTGEECIEGTCQIRCAEGLTRCGTVCVNLSVSTEHCGACESACPSGRACQNGLCEGRVETLVGKSWYANGPGTQATFYQPIALTIDRKGNLYVVDRNHFRIRIIDPTGKVSDFAGTGHPAVQNGPVLSAEFQGFTFATINANDELYVAGSDPIRKIAKGQVSTITSFSRNAPFSGPFDKVYVGQSGKLLFDSKGQIYLAIHSRNKDQAPRRSEIARIDAKGELTVLAGGVAGDADGVGTTAKLNSPQGMALDEANQLLYFADQGNDSIRMLSLASLQVTTIAGGSDGFQDGSSAKFGSIHGIALNPAKTHLYIADAKNHRIRRLDLKTRLVDTVIGTGLPGWADGHITKSAQLYSPMDLVFDGMGGLYIADAGNHVIRYLPKDSTELQTPYGRHTKQTGPADQVELRRPTVIVANAQGEIFFAEEGSRTIKKIDPKTMTISIAAGGRVGGCLEGKASKARFRDIRGMTFDSRGILYISDEGCKRIRRWNPTTDEVSSVAGNGNWGTHDGKALSAGFSGLRNLAVDPLGKLLYILDGHTLRTYGPLGSSNPQVNTLSSKQDCPQAPQPCPTTGALSQSILRHVQGLGFDQQGNIYISEYHNHRIVKVANGQVSTFAGANGRGSSDGPGLQASFFHPQSLAVDKRTGRIFVAETLRHAIRTITPQGVVSSINQANTCGAPVNGPAPQAQFYYPRGIAIGPKGELYVADTYNHVIRVIHFQK